MVFQTSRRDIIKLGAGAAAYSSLAKAADSHHISGYVRCHESGRGLSGILVSNGRNIVRTDADGFYQMAVDEDDVIFVIKPRDYAPLLDDRMLPKLHAPAGVRNHDFYLVREPEEESFDVLLIADPQPGNREELGYLANLLALMTQQKMPRFAITLGDLIGDQPQLYDAYNQLMAQLRVPIWNLPGNHDLDFSKSTPTAARDIWRQLYGPGTRAFEYGSALFITLDNIGHGPSKGSHYGYVGYVGADNLRFMESLLRDVPKDQLIVLAMHIPLVSSAPIEDLSSRTHDHQALLALLEGRNCISLSGHMHSYEHHEVISAGAMAHQHHVINALCGSWWTGPFDPSGQPVAQSCDGTPNGWYILSVQGTEARLKFQPARSSLPMRIMVGAGQGQSCTLLPQGISCDELRQAKLLVNVFSGGHKTRVFCRLNGQEVRWMSRIHDFDPSTQALFRAAGEKKKSWIEPVTSTHLWATPLPQDLLPGIYRMDVEVYDGNKLSMRSVYFLDVLPG